MVRLSVGLCTRSFIARWVTLSLRFHLLLSVVLLESAGEHSAGNYSALVVHCAAIAEQN